jgi:hypothetical protein
MGTGCLSGITFTQGICCLSWGSIIGSPLTDVSGTPGSYFNPSKSGKYRETSWGVIIVHIVLYMKEPTFWANKQQINIQLPLIYRSVGNKSNNDLLVVEPKTSENEGA